MLVIGMLSIPRGRVLIIEVFRLVISSVYMFNICMFLVEVFDCGGFIRSFSVVVYGLYVLFNVFIYNIHVNEIYVYDSLEIEDFD